MNKNMRTSGMDNGISKNLPMLKKSQNKYSRTFWSLKSGLKTPLGIAHPHFKEVGL